MYIPNRRPFKDVHRLVKEALWDHWVGEALCSDSSSVEYACRQSKQTRFIVSCRFVTYCTCQYVYLSATVRQTTANEYTCSAAYVHFYSLKIVITHLIPGNELNMFSMMFFSRKIKPLSYKSILLVHFLFCQIIPIILNLFLQTITPSYRYSFTIYGGVKV